MDAVFTTLFYTVFNDDYVIVITEEHIVGLNLRSEWYVGLNSTF